MNDFTDLVIKTVYESSEITDFYNNLLQLSSEYKRVSAYFDFKLFEYVSKGILGLLKNNGHMKLIVSADISDELLEKIKKGIQKKSEVSLEKVLKIKDDLILDSKVRDLVFLVSIGLLDIKVAVSVKKTGIMHEKYGLITDRNGNCVLFSGSNNETSAALNNNYESFETTLSWETSERALEKIKFRNESFEKLWYNKNSELLVIEASQYILNRLSKNKRIEIPKNIGNYIVFDIIDNKLHLKSNFDLGFLLTDNEFHEWRNQISPNSRSLGNGMQFDSDFSNFIEDVIRFEEAIVNHKTKYNYNVVYDTRYTKYKKSRYIDMEKLRSIGEKIKSSNFIDSEEFNTFYTKVNGMLLRKLRTAQAISTYHAINIKRSLNFSVPGSGKTSSILAAYQFLYENNIVDKLLVIGPLNCFKSWKDECSLTLKDWDEFQCINLHQKCRKDVEFIVEKDFDKSSTRLVLVNFEGVKNISAILNEKINEKTMVVFDEVHRVKNPDGIYYKNVKNVISKSIYRVALTGTPLPNSFQDLVNLFELLFDKYALTYFNFYKEFIRKIDGKSEKDISSICNKIAPFYTRISKADLQIKPPEDDHLIYVESTSMESQKYREIYDNTSINPLHKIIKLLCFEAGHKIKKADLCEETFYEGNYYLTNNADFEENLKTLTSKIYKTVELVKMLIKQHKKVIIWCSYIETIKKLEKCLKNELGHKSVQEIHGNTGHEQRGNIINEFNKSNSDLQVLITNPQTMAESVSLHKCCHDAIFVELNYNLSQYLQARDRIHRLGIADNQQTNYYILINKYDDLPSIGERIYKRLEEKKDVMLKSLDIRYFLNIENKENDIKSLLDDK